MDIPFVALLIWAAALEAAHPRRGLPVMALLALAGLLRPEAWLFAGIYLVWMLWPDQSRVRLLSYFTLAVLPPALWAGLDFAVTGDPLLSLHRPRRARSRWSGFAGSRTFPEPSSNRSGL